MMPSPPAALQRHHDLPLTRKAVAKSRSMKPRDPYSLHPEGVCSGLARCEFRSVSLYLVAVNLEEPTGNGGGPGRHRAALRIGRKPESLDGESVDLLRVTWDDRLVSRNHCEAVRDEDDHLTIRRLPAPSRTGHAEPPPFQRRNERTPSPRRAGRAPPRGSFVFGAEATPPCIGSSPSPTSRASWIAITRSATARRRPTKTPRQCNPPGYDEVEQLDEYSLRLQLKLLQRSWPQQVLSGWTDEEDLFTRAAVFLEKRPAGTKRRHRRLHRRGKGRPTGSSSRFSIPIPSPAPTFRPSRTLLKPHPAHQAQSGRHPHLASKDNNRVFSAETSGQDRLGHDHPGGPPRRIGRDLPRRAAPPRLPLTRDAPGLGHRAAAFVPFIRLIGSLVASLLSARADQKMQDQMAAYFPPGLRKILASADQSNSSRDGGLHRHVATAGHSATSSWRRATRNPRAPRGEPEGRRSHHRGGLPQPRRRHRLRRRRRARALGLANFGARTRTTPSSRSRRPRPSFRRPRPPRAIRGGAENRHMAAVRIGISTGRIAVGKTGPSQQWHISVFGSVANLGARLERIAKEFRVPVLISDETYRRIKGHGNRSFRQLCLIRPAGFAESYRSTNSSCPARWRARGISDEARAPTSAPSTSSTTRNGTTPSTS